jgi:hypothetical protein
VTDFRVGDHDTGLDDISRRDLELDTRRDDLEVHLRLGQFDRLEACTVKPLQNRQHILRQIEVVQAAVAVGQHRAHLPIQRPNHPSLTVGLQPCIDVPVEKTRLLRPHAFEVRERNLQLFSELAACEVGYPVLATVTALGIDNHLQFATLVGVALQERRGHDQVPLRRELALEFQRQTYHGTSAFHIDYSKRKAGTADPGRGLQHPRWGH